MVNWYVKQYTKLFLTQIVILSLVACQAANITKDFAFEPNSTTGLVIGSITQDIKVPKATNATFYFDDTVSGKSWHIAAQETSALGTMLFRSQFLKDNLNGRLFVIELPAGRHRIRTWRIETGMGRYYPRIPPNIYEFNIKSGEATYLGNLHMKLITGKFFLGIPMTGGGMPVINDYTSRDLELFKKQYPDLVDKPINIDILPLGPWRNDLQDVGRDLKLPLLEEF